MSVWNENIISWISEVKQYKETMANEQSQKGRGKDQIDEITYTKEKLLLIVKNRELWTLRSKLWTSQIRALINNFVIVLVCAICSQLITWVENIMSALQLPLCLSLFFAFFSEVLNGGKKSCFNRDFFQDAVCEEYFSIRFQCLHL